MRYKTIGPQTEPGTQKSLDAAVTGAASSDDGEERSSVKQSTVEHAAIERATVEHAVVERAADERAANERAAIPGAKALPVMMCSRAAVERPCRRP